MTFPVPDPLAYLAGRWSITRTLSDTNTSGTFTGSATFTPDAKGLSYEERGVLDLGHWRGESYRILHYAPVSPGILTATFPNGRFFHDLDLRTGVWTAHHPCGADAYEGRFMALSENEWHQKWRVHGPAKDQLIESVFHRTGPLQSS